MGYFNVSVNDSSWTSVQARTKQCLGSNELPYPQPMYKVKEPDGRMGTTTGYCSDVEASSCCSRTWTFFFSVLRVKSPFLDLHSLRHKQPQTLLPTSSKDLKTPSFDMAPKPCKKLFIENFCKLSFINTSWIPSKFYSCNLNCTRENRNMT